MLGHNITITSKNSKSKSDLDTMTPPPTAQNKKKSRWTGVVHHIQKEHFIKEFKTKVQIPDSWACPCRRQKNFTMKLLIML